MDEVSVVPQSSNHGTEFEHLHVRSVYDEIAPCMNDIQHKAWPNVKRFLKKLPAGALVADIGCGNGRYLNINNSTYKIGMDVCLPLVDHARAKGHEVCYGDNLHIPYRDGCFDAVVSVGVIHHFCSHDRRVAAVRELARILSRGGQLMIYVWAYEQKRRKFESQDVLIPWNENSRYGKRLGSTSSTQSTPSLGGLSSTGSMSEDDLAGPDDDPVSNTPSPKLLRRQSSVSLDDLSVVRELADFKPSYYSLEFDASPRRNCKHKLKDKYVWNNKSQLGAHNQKKDTLIQECRRLEASLRAMSSGSLDVMEKTAQVIITDTVTSKDRHSLENLPISQAQANCKSNSKHTNSHSAKNAEKHISNSGGSKTPSCHDDDKSPGCYDDTDGRHGDTIGNHGDMNGCHSDENDCHGNLENAHSQSGLNVNLDWNLGGLDYEDFEGEIMGNEVIVDSGFSEKLCDDFEPGPSVSSSIFSKVTPTVDIKVNGEVIAQSRGHGVRRKTPQINPFMKENSFDHYTFNSVHDISDESESIEVIYEHNEEFEGPDPVFVDYKQPNKSPKEDKSFFSAVKSKLFNLIDKKTQTVQPPQSAMRKNQSFNNLNSRMPNNSSTGKLLGRALSKPEFTSEQAALADKLNFQVREFPLSSCANVVGDKMANQSKTGSENSKQKGNQSAHHGQLGSKGGSSGSSNGFLEFCQSKQFSVNDCRNSADSGICEVIYDGYIKLEPDKIPDGKPSAFKRAPSIEKSSDRKKMVLNDNSSCEKQVNMPRELSKYSEVNKNKIGTKTGNESTTQCNVNNEITSHSGNSSPSLRSRRQRKSPVFSRLNSNKSTEDADLSTEDIVFDNATTMTSENGTADGRVPSRLSRYYHVFKEGELERLISCYIPKLKVVQCFYDHANWCVIAEKL